ncbi:MAG: 4Fe-4S ferredoxin, partial [Fusobacteriaceae bacterium]
NACRNICPACNCETCVFENKDEDVLGKANNKSETGFYQIIRAYHVAGRCSDCGECERICPLGIPLGKINKKIIKDLEELYGAEEDSLSNFDIEDKDSFSAKKGGK